MDHRFLFTVLSIISLLLLGCERREHGPTGPAGQDGNANVDMVNFTFSAASFSMMANNDSLAYTHTFNIPELTLSIVDGGAVLLYIRSASFEWQALPADDQTWPLAISYQFGPASLTIEISTTTGDAKNDLIQFFGGETDYQARLILIPANSSLAKTSASLKKLSYDDLKTRLSLPE